MNIDIDPVDLLNDDQKNKIGDALFNKMLKGIEGVEFSNRPIDLHEDIKDEIGNILENGDIWEHVDFEKIGKALSNKILKGVSK